MMKFWSLNKGEENVLEIMHEIDSDDYWGTGEVSASNDFRRALNECKGNMNVLINSPGGDTFAGADMYSALREYAVTKGKVTCYITGLAASAASIVAMAGDEIVISEVGMMMIHDPWMIAVGNASQLRDLADTLDKVRDAVANAYVSRTGKDEDEIRQMMASERYMTASEAVTDGFADRIGVYGQKPLAIAACILPDEQNRILSQMMQAADDFAKKTRCSVNESRERDRLALRLRARCV